MQTSIEEMPGAKQEGAKEQRTVPCAHCGRVVEARRPHRKFCSPACRMAAWWRAKKNEGERK